MPTVEFTWQDQNFQLIQEGVGAGSKFYIDGDESAWMAVTEFPVPYADANHGLRTLGRLVKDGKPGVWTFSRLWEVQDDIERQRERRRIDAEMRRQEDLERQEAAELEGLRDRLAVLRREGYYTHHIDKAVNSLVHPGYNWIQQAPPTLATIRKKIERVENEPLQVLLEAILEMGVHAYNLDVLKKVRILSHRSGGKIEVVSEDYLKAFYAEAVTDPRVDRLDTDALRFDLDYFVSPSDLEGVELAPERVQAGEEKCRIEYVIEKDTDVVVTVVTMTLATFRAHKDGLEELLPKGKLKLRLTGHKNGDVEGELGPDLDRRVSKLSKRR